MQYLEALRLNNPTIVLTTFINYLKDEKYLNILRNRMGLIHQETGINPDTLWSWGPKVNEWGENTVAKFPCYEASK